MPLSALTGQPRALSALRAALSSGTLHHAYLFGGPEGVGKELAALGLAQALLCSKVPGEGCGKCSACTRIERHSHPDVTWVMPEAVQVARGLAGRSDFAHTPSRDIRVEQIRGLQERLALRGLESRRKVAIVAPADAMNPQAQNAFLKTLEEPPADTVLVLLSSAPDSLLPTLRSRCSTLSFGPLPLALLVERVREQRDLDGPTAQLVAVMAGGSLSRALELDVKALERRKELIERFEGLGGGQSSRALEFAEEFGQSREDAEGCLKILTLWLRDLSVVQADAGALANSDLEDLARKVAAKHSPTSLDRRHRLVEDALEAITERNASARLQLERILIQMGAA